MTDCIPECIRFPSCKDRLAEAGVSGSVITSDADTLPLLSNLAYVLLESIRRVALSGSVTISHCMWECRVLDCSATTRGQRAVGSGAALRSGPCFFGSSIHAHQGLRGWLQSLLRST